MPFQDTGLLLDFFRNKEQCDTLFFSGAIIYWVVFIRVWKVKSALDELALKVFSEIKRRALAFVLSSSYIDTSQSLRHGTSFQFKHNKMLLAIAFP